MNEALWLPSISVLVKTGAPSQRKIWTLRKLADNVSLIRWATPRPCKLDRKSTRLNSSHGYISYAVFCLKNTKASFGSKTSNHLPVDCPDLIAMCTPHLTFISYGTPAIYVTPAQGDPRTLDHPVRFYVSV